MTQDKRIQELLNVLATQRNRALDTVAELSAELFVARARIAELEKPKEEAAQ